MDRSRRPFAALAGAAVVAALVLLPGTVASAAGSTGWLRLAHLSPDTKKVDVTLSSLSGGTVLYKLSGVGYGDVSPYMKLEPGTYAVAMVPSDAPSSADPVVDGQVTVKAGAAETLAALGRNKDIATKLYSDDLDEPAGEEARVKVIQASVKHDAVDVTSGSTALGKDVGFGDATSYATVQVSPGSRYWSVSYDAWGRKIGCWVTTPPRYATVGRTVMVQAPQVVPVAEPAQYGYRSHVVQTSPGYRTWTPIGRGGGFGLSSAFGLASAPVAAAGYGVSAATGGAFDGGEF